MIRVKLFFVPFFIIFITLGCSSTPPLKEAIGECKNDLRTLNAYGDTIQLEYDVESKPRAEEAAKAWCEDRNKYATKNTNSCENGCCVTTYRCRK